LWLDIASGNLSSKKKRGSQLREAIENPFSFLMTSCHTLCPSMCVPLQQSPHMGECLWVSGNRYNLFLWSSMVSNLLPLFESAIFNGGNWDTNPLHAVLRPGCSAQPPIMPLDM
jgi:hypothetical protein